MTLLEKINSPGDLKNLTIQQLGQVAEETRALIIDTMMKSGGHLSSNLGAVELTIALHYVFDVPKDKLIFDVGHQCYTHKILTGRRDRFWSIRQKGGISGFPRICESEYDMSTCGHASASLSTACGFAQAHIGDDCEIITLLGDGAMTGGMSFEALNNLVSVPKKQIILLNDNQMAISKNIGFVSSFLNKLKLKMPSQTLYDLGLRYIGPVDGHDLNALIGAMREAKESAHSVLVHIETVKGKGYAPAEQNSQAYHGYPVSDKAAKSFSHIAGNKIYEIAKTHPNVFAVTAAMEEGTGLEKMATCLPDQFRDVGIAESHAMTFCSGMAASGLKPYFCVYSTFLQRAFDNLFHDVCIASLPVTVCIDRAGFVAGDGETHQGIYDLTFLRCLPNIVVASPKDGEELEQLLDLSMGHNGPFAIRYPKGYFEFDGLSHSKFCVGEWEYIKKSEGRVAILFCGSVMLKQALECSEILMEKGIQADIVNARFVKPLDEKMLLDMNYGLVVTLEENVKSGGLGSAVAEFFIDQGKDQKMCIFGAADRTYPACSKEDLLHLSGLDSKSITNKIMEKLNETR